MATFIETITSAHEDKKLVGLTLDEKFMRIGQVCPLLPHLEGIELPRSCFIALNVQTAEKRIIPFFSVSRKGVVDTASLRKEVVNKAKESNLEGFLTCPMFIEKYKIESLEVNIRVEDDRFKVRVDAVKSYIDTDNDALKAEKRKEIKEEC